MQVKLPPADSFELRLAALDDLPALLIENGDKEKLHRALTDYGFVQEKVGLLGARVAVDDYEAAARAEMADEAMRAVGAALELSMLALDSTAEVLPAQLMARLLDTTLPEVRQVLATAVQAAPRPWLRPLLASLSMPGGQLARQLGEEGGRWMVHGRRAVFFAKNGTASVWDIESGRRYGPIDLPGVQSTKPVAALRGNGVLSTSGNVVGLWDLESREEVARVATGESAIREMCATPDAAILLTIHEDGWLRGWDLSAGDQLLAIDAEAGRFPGLRIDPDGRHSLIWCCGKEDPMSGSDLVLHDLSNGDEACRINGVRKVGIATPDLHRATYGTGHTLKTFVLVELPSGRELARTGDGVRCSAIAADGRRAAFGCDRGQLRIWDLQAGKELLVLDHPALNPYRVEIAQGSTGELRAAKAASDNLPQRHTPGLGTRIDGGSGEAQVITGKGSISHVALTPDGGRAVTIGIDGGVIVWDLEASSELSRLPAHSGQHRGKVDRGADLVTMPSADRVVTTTNNGLLRVWNPGIREVRTWGHSAKVTCASVAAAGRLAATGAQNGTVKIWDCTDGSEIWAFRTDTEALPVEDLVFVRPRKLACIWSDRAGIWDLDARAPLWSVRRPGEYATSLAASPDGTYVIVGSRHGVARVFNTDTGEELKALVNREAEHWNPVEALAVTTDGKHIIACYSSGAITTWDASSRRSARDVGGDPKTAMRHAVVVGEDRWLVTGALSKLTVWDLQDRRDPIQLSAGEKNWLKGLFALPGPMVASVHASGDVVIWSVERDAGTAEVARYSCGNGNPGFAHIDASASRLAAASGRIVTLWDLASGEVVGRFATDETLSACAITADGSAVIAGDEAGGVHVLGVEDADTKPASLPPPRVPTGLQAAPKPSPDRPRRMIVARGSGPDQVASWKAPSPALAVSFGLDAEVVYCTYANGTIGILHLDGEETRAMPWRGSFGRQSAGLGISPSARWAAALFDDGRLCMHALDRGSEIVTRRALAGLEQHVDSIGPRCPMAVLDAGGVIGLVGGKHLFMASWDAKAGSWEVCSVAVPRLIQTLSIDTIATDSAGAQVVLGTKTGALVFFSVQHRTFKMLRAHSSPVRSVGASGGGAVAFSAEEDGTIRAWDLHEVAVRKVLRRRRIQLCELTGHKGPTTALAADDEGRTLLSASQDGTLRSWDIRRGRPLASVDLRSPLLSCHLARDEATAVASDEAGGVWVVRLPA